MSVRLGLLALLDQADMYGYQLKAQFEAQTGGIWPLNIGQVYSTLERLERDGLVAVVTAPKAAEDQGEGSGAEREVRTGGSAPAEDTEAGGAGRGGRSGGREQKYYAITRTGRDALAEWFTAGLAEAPPPRDELVAKVLFALVGGRDHALAVITRQRTALTAALQARRRERQALVGHRDHRLRAVGAASARPVAEGAAALSVPLVTDALIARAEADLRWLDLCEARVSQLTTDSADPTGQASSEPESNGGGAT